jgi:hypothetical protein
MRIEHKIDFSKRISYASLQKELLEKIGQPTEQEKGNQLVLEVSILFHMLTILGTMARTESSHSLELPSELAHLAGFFTQIVVRFTNEFLTPTQQGAVTREISGMIIALPLIADGAQVQIQSPAT